ncbi:MAG: 16S rRNA (adenine(1518)-N(6)/adenine(1519)-N(6))-dimethyltransferase RsmA [Clostridia bacterium]|nr:16S rRNA (adenine(1518)-N(6)/adenine(1519)-N(6))-dimethyltransferase RsmA [Clostridia bacterium]
MGDEFDFGRARRLLEENGFSFRHDLGQNFLTNAGVLKKIAGACGTDRGSGVLEIGPGAGSLTYYLAQEYRKVVAVEIDSRLMPVLAGTLDQTNIKILNEDFLKTDLDGLIEREFDGMRVSVCANLPYYVTTPILVKLVESGIKFESIVVMVQSEVADRFCAAPGSGDYGAITVFLNYFGKAERLFTVSPDKFVPMPKVSSAVVRITPAGKPASAPEDRERLFKVVTAAFSQRRKTLLNALASTFKGLGKPEIAGIIAKCGFRPDIRGERLSLDDFSRLADEIFSSIAAKTE